MLFDKSTKPYIIYNCTQYPYQEIIVCNGYNNSDRTNYFKTNSYISKYLDLVW